MSELDVDRLAVAINAARPTCSELRLGRDLRVPADRIAAAYDRLAPPADPSASDSLVLLMAFRRFVERRYGDVFTEAELVAELRADNGD